MAKEVKVEEAKVETKVEETQVETKTEEKKKFELPKPVKTGLKWLGVAGLTAAGFILGEKIGENRAIDGLDLEVLDLDSVEEF